MVKVENNRVSKSKVGGWRGSDVFKPKPCAVCGKTYKPNSGAQRMCSKACGLTKNRSVNNTEAQYERISGNWSKYLTRLVANTRRKNSSITRDILFRILDKQKRKCALSGIALTCVLRKGLKIHTNASVDRIDCFKDYTPDNIQLVCSALNSFKGTTPNKKFVWWCKQVTNHNAL